MKSSTTDLSSPIPAICRSQQEILITPSQLYNENRNKNNNDEDKDNSDSNNDDGNNSNDDDDNDNNKEEVDRLKSSLSSSSSLSLSCTSYSSVLPSPYSISTVGNTENNIKEIY